jgi:hypothetical protein
MPQGERDEELNRLRALVARTYECRTLTGVRKFFHDLAERSAQPSKNVIMARLRDDS